MPDWSKIGRSSRRKGNAYERKIGHMLTKATGFEWRRTPASGGLSWPGDVIIVNHDKQHFVNSHLLIECKNYKITDKQKACFTKWKSGLRRQIQPLIEMNGAVIVMIFYTLKGGGSKVWWYVETGIGSTKPEIIECEAALSLVHGFVQEL